MKAVKEQRTANGHSTNINKQSKEKIKNARL